ncbi:MAG: hypothetical protein HFI63_04745 [Lachnospiraceae bacterium]|nr:hypothetical protein [Lachnospiraceae bacterium]
MKDAMSQITYWYEQYYGDGFFLVMAMASYLYLFAYEKTLRKKLLYPVALLVFCIVNPLLYFLVFHQIVYWRLFWVIPDALIIAYALTKLVQACRKTADKLILMFFVFVFVLFKGTNVYQNGEFPLIKNVEKVSKPVEEVCDFMLELEASPTCILPEPFLCQARQYSGEIRSMYGRNVQGYIMDASEEQWGTYLEMESGMPDFELIFRRASEFGCKFVVTYERNVVEENVLSMYNYQEVGNVSGYRIYYSGDGVVKTAAKVE